MINGSKIKIFKTRVVDTDERCEIGRVCSVGNEGFTVQTGNGILEILEIQKEGKKRMLCRDFLRGFKLNSGDILG
jgi:methionyl-tRNA formyltransferase